MTLRCVHSGCRLMFGPQHAWCPPGPPPRCRRSCTNPSPDPLWLGWSRDRSPRLSSSSCTWTTSARPSGVRLNREPVLPLTCSCHACASVQRSPGDSEQGGRPSFGGVQDPRLLPLRSPWSFVAPRDQLQWQNLTVERAFVQQAVQPGQGPAVPNLPSP